ncbi:hypothetical protein [Acidiphilium sp. JA12-A1]|uniref:hypothetical protein n=1 Tax=Acidiphilium sp. JA12-A1 TaxID=1464546 RepID=UPI00046170BD|nr:hypothetical protein [Acidiphilium sp. JA12-A1]KDM66636.1 hypothetical protein ACIDI_56c00120 [Acidiphilium sp. JA12-A1]
MSDREGGFDDPGEDRDQPDRPVQSSRYSPDQIEDMKDVASVLGLDLPFDSPCGDITPNLLTPIRETMSPAEYDRHLDEMAALLRAAISAAWDREAKRQKRLRKKGKRRHGP